MLQRDKRCDGGPVQGCCSYRVGQGCAWGQLEEDKRRENHKKAFPERGRYFAVIELSDTCIAWLSEIYSQLFPSLSHSCIVTEDECTSAPSKRHKRGTGLRTRIQSAFIVGFLAPAGERNVLLVCGLAQFGLPQRCIGARCILAVKI